MPVFRVYLECASPTNRRGGTFDTFVAVDEDQLARGEHIRIAVRRAMTVGFAGPHRIAEVRRLDVFTRVMPVTGTVLEQARPTAAAPSAARLLSIVDAAIIAEPVAPGPEAPPRPVPPTPTRPSRRGRIAR